VTDRRCRIVAVGAGRSSPADKCRCLRGEAGWYAQGKIRTVTQDGLQPPQVIQVFMGQEFDLYR